MRVRNALFAPPFIMYYLTFLLPDAENLLRRQGSEMEIRDLGLGKPWTELRLVVARRPQSSFWFSRRSRSGAV